MLLYLTRRDRLPAAEEFPACDCAQSEILKEPHVCFTSEPVAGRGPWVYIVDLPDEVASKFEYESAFRIKNLRHFAVPVATLQHYPRHEYEYEKLTGGRNWRKWNIVLKRPNDRQEAWSQVWISRPGVALASEVSKAPEMVVEIELTELFSPARDYVIVEHQKFGGHEWELELLAGVLPGWADHPQRWHRWVHNPKIQQSAIEYIVSAAPSVRRFAENARRQTNKLNMISAWQHVADEVSDELNVSLGKIPAGSLTSTMAMPIRIAERIGRHLAEKWVPPTPKPEFEHPDQSGRVLLATPDKTRLSSFSGERSKGPNDSREPPRGKSPRAVTRSVTVSHRA